MPERMRKADIPAGHGSSFPPPRRETRRIMIGSVAVGGGAPVSVQSMTKTDTRDVAATVAQIRRLEESGCEIVRLAVPDHEAAAALAGIKKQARIPIVADIHFNHRLALEALKAGADGLRINPGNIGAEEGVRKVVGEAKARNVPIRIGVNSGSLGKPILKKYGAATAEAMVESALGHIRILEDMGFGLIKVSLKASDVARTVEACRLLARTVDYPFHAGITEAGSLIGGAVRSSVGLGILLAEGLADTIRVSLTAPPEDEVEVGFLILRSLGLRSRGLNLISCPTCGRLEMDLPRIVREVERRLISVEEPLTVALMGCMVNGPGEAKEADIGLACGKRSAVVFKRGKPLRRLKEKEIISEFVKEVRRLTAQKKRGRKSSKDRHGN